MKDNVDDGEHDFDDEEHDVDHGKDDDEHDIDDGEEDGEHDGYFVHLIELELDTMVIW